MARTLKAFINDGVCSSIQSDFDRIEVDGETVWVANMAAHGEDLRLPELMQEMEQKAAEWDATGMLGAARVARRWKAWLEAAKEQ